MVGQGRAQSGGVCPGLSGFLAPKLQGQSSLVNATKMNQHVIMLLTALLSLNSLVSAENPVRDWNQWRGPNRDGIVANASWPTRLDGLELVWEKSHAPSYSGPVVRGEFVFTTETIDKSNERVTAYRLVDGETVWQREWPGAMSVPFFAAANGDWIRSTPSCEGETLVVLGMRDVLVCLDSSSGSEQWRVDFPAQMKTPLPSFGAVCSPIIDGDSIYVQTGGAVVRLRRSDGGLVWKTLEDGAGMMSSGAFSSPVIATLSGMRQLVVQTRQELCGVDLSDGSVLWREPIQAFRGMNILTPLVIGDTIFTSAHSGRAQLFRIGKNENGWTVKELWNKNLQAYMSSPVVIGESIFLHLKNQRVTALNLSDGTSRWTSSPFGKYWSMVSNGKQLLALDANGSLRLINPDAQSLQVVDEKKVASDAWAHLAVQDDLVIVRDLRSLKVYRWQ